MIKSLQVNFCFQETGVLEELGRFERHWHVRRKKLLPLMRLFLGRLPWRGGKRLNMCRKPRLGTENDFNHLDFFVAKKNCSGSNFVFKKVRFWRSCEFPSVIGTSVVKSYCPNCLYFWGDFLGEGVNDSICVENLDLAPKMTSTISCCGNMIL